MGITSGAGGALFGVFVVAVCSYAGGRLHEWIRRGRERDAAYRDGYNEATQALWAMAVKTRGAAAGGPAAASRGRHQVDDRVTRDLRAHRQSSSI